MNLSTTGLRLTADTAIDLHLHTTFSDGRWSPASLLDHLLREQFGLAAISDHDRADTVAFVQQLAQDKRLPVLVAVEMTTTWKREMTDLLCFGFDPSENALNDLCQDMLRRQQENTRQVFDTLQRQGHALSPDVLSAVLAEPSSEQPHALVAALVEHGYASSESSAATFVMTAGCEFAMTEPAAVVEAARRSGAVCLLAHPGRGDGFVTYDDQLLDQFRRQVPIDGLEVYSPAHTPAQVAMYRDYADRHHLLVSAGSDSHRPEVPPVKYPARLCAGLLERVGTQIE